MWFREGDAPRDLDGSRDRECVASVGDLGDFAGAFGERAGYVGGDFEDVYDGDGCVDGLLDDAYDECAWVCVWWLCAGGDRDDAYDACWRSSRTGYVTLREIFCGPASGLACDERGGERTPAYGVDSGSLYRLRSRSRSCGFGVRDGGTARSSGIDSNVEDADKDGYVELRPSSRPLLAAREPGDSRGLGPLASPRGAVISGLSRPSGSSEKDARKGSGSAPAVGDPDAGVGADDRRLERLLDRLGGLERLFERLGVFEVDVEADAGA